MNHEKEIDQLCRELFHHSGRSDEEYNEVVNWFFEESGLTKQRISDDIQTGIENGYSFDKQLFILKMALRRVWDVLMDEPLED